MNRMRWAGSVAEAGVIDLMEISVQQPAESNLGLVGFPPLYCAKILKPLDECKFCERPEIMLKDVARSL